MPDSIQIARWAAKAAEEHKAKEVVILDLRDITLIADYFVICSGRLSVQVKAIAQNVIDCLKNQEVKVLHQEGLRDGYWVLLDYGSVIVHVFREEEREFYSLERLWGDAGQVLLDEKRPEAEDRVVTG